LHSIYQEHYWIGETGKIILVLSSCLHGCIIVPISHAPCPASVQPTQRSTLVEG
jgi:hypothetical protein